MSRQANKMSALCVQPSVISRSRDGDVAIFTVLRQAWREEVRGEFVPMNWLRGGAKFRFVSFGTGFQTSRVVVRDVVLLDNLRTHGTESKTSRCNSSSRHSKRALPARECSAIKTQETEPVQGATRLLNLERATLRIFLSFHSSLCPSCSGRGPWIANFCGGAWMPFNDPFACLSIVILTY